MDLIMTTGTRNTLLLAGLGIVGVFSISYFFRNIMEENDDEAQQQNISKKPAGIYNEGNTCFVNSLLQGLASIQSFKQNISQLLEERQIVNLDQKALQQLLKVITKINSNNESIQIISFLQCLSELHSGLINFQQQDAHELFTLITKLIDNTFNQRNIVNLSKQAITQTKVVQNLLQGYSLSSITCLSCKTQTKISVDVFYSISLEIQPAHIRSLDMALKWYQRQQYIDNWICTKCSINNHINVLRQVDGKLYGEKNKSLKLICLDFIRYLGSLDIGDDQLSQVNEKLQAYVKKYEKEYLQMINNKASILKQIFVLIDPVYTRISKRTVITKYPKIFVIHFKQLSIDPFTGRPQLLRKHIDYNPSFQVSLRNGIRKYQLTSLLTHVGNQNMGHYFTFRKINKSLEDWYVISDTRSQACKWNYLKNNVPYMLFYEAE